MNKWDKRFLSMAKNVATWSKDPSKQIGAILVGEKRQVVAQGYNSFPRGIEDLPERYNDRDKKLAYIIHAEEACILNASFNRAQIIGSTIYVANLPVCHECAKTIIQSGIKRVVGDTYPQWGTRWFKSGMLAIEMFDEAGVEWEYMDASK